MLVCLGCWRKQNKGFNKSRKLIKVMGGVQNVFLLVSSDFTMFSCFSLLDKNAVLSDQRQRILYDAGLLCDEEEKDEVICMSMNLI